MEKERRIKVLSLVALIVAVLGLTIAFAALSQTLTINGRASMGSSQWDVHFENLSGARLYGYANEVSTPQIVENGIKIENMNVLLKKPKDKVIYTVEIVNDGTINAKIEQIQMTQLTEEQSKYLEFYATYSDGRSISESNILKANQREKVKIVIGFKEDITEEDLPKETTTINLSLTIDYVQTDEKGSSDIDPSENVYNLGDDIALGNEHFYVVNDDGNTVTALARYNLLVGNNFDTSTRTATPIPSTTEGYGLQNADAKAMNGNDIRKGTISYTELSSHVSNYETYLKGLGYNTVSVSLPSYNLKDTFSCEIDNSGNLSCYLSPSWVYYSSYWFDTAIENGEVYYLSGKEIYTSDPSANHRAGLRPVITISKSEL